MVLCPQWLQYIDPEKQEVEVRLVPLTIITSDIFSDFVLL